MGEVVDFTDSRFQKFAKTFVDIYETEGGPAAAFWAADNVTKEEYPTAREYITEEFKSRGYTFSEDMDDEEIY